MPVQTSSFIQFKHAISLYEQPFWFCMSFSFPSFSPVTFLKNSTSPITAQHLSQLACHKKMWIHLTKQLDKFTRLLGWDFTSLQGLVSSIKILESCWNRSWVSQFIYVPPSPHLGPSSSLQPKAEMLCASTVTPVCLTCCMWAVVCGILASPTQASHVQRICLGLPREVTSWKVTRNILA